MKNKRINLTLRQIEVITELNHPVYTVDYIETWCNYSGSITENAVATLASMGASAYLQAVNALINLDIKQNIQKLKKEIHEQDLLIEHLQASIDSER